MAGWATGETNHPAALGPWRGPPACFDELVPNRSAHRSNQGLSTKLTTLTSRTTRATAGMAKKTIHSSKLFGSSVAGCGVGWGLCSCQRLICRSVAFLSASCFR